jgi:hypothetical protein
VAVTDGSYIRELYPNLCLAAFVLECAKGQGWMIGSVSESLTVANAYRGELLGLMAIHLILLSINKMNCELSGKVEILSDCLGALRRVSSLPPYRIPSRCQHSDILKNLLVNCWYMSFTLYYSHVKAHQDDKKSFKKLSRQPHRQATNCNQWRGRHDARTNIPPQADRFIHQRGKANL